MRRERVTDAEIRAAIRGQGYAAMEAIDAVVLETDGSFTCAQRADDGQRSALANVGGRDQARGKFAPGPGAGAEDRPLR